MTTTGTWHRHIGVYGLCLDLQAEHLFLIKKAHGPYRGRYDLPGGSLKTEKSLTETLLLEFVEETGSQVEILHHLGAYDFLVQVPHKETTHTHHIALLYQVRFLSTDPAWVLQKQWVNETGVLENNDSTGAVWVPLGALTEDNISPLVRKALEWLRDGQLSSEMVTYDPWSVKENAM